MSEPDESEERLTIDELVTSGTAGIILLVFAIFVLCYWCNKGERVTSEQLREEFAREHGLDAYQLAKGSPHQSLIEETSIT